MWKAESNIFNFLYKNNTLNKTDDIKIKKYAKILDFLFPHTINSFQKIAIAFTLINNVTFILGGPGTGKTTAILKIIIALIKNSKKSIKIQLCAPTGKATTRLTNIINNNIFNDYLSKKEKQYLPSNAVTIHQLLGIQKISQHSFFNKNNTLDIDVLIIDETSMIDILMMEKIFHATSQDTKLIFIGDHNQLRPIEAGSILKDIYYYFNNGYSEKTISNLEKITGYKLYNKINMQKTNYISDKICLLKKNYRFKNNIGLYILSNAIYTKNIKVITNVFKNLIKNIIFYDNTSNKQYKQMIEIISLNYQKYWEKIYQDVTIQEIIKTFQSYQVLCILKDSIFGTKILNKKIEENMHQKNMIKYFYLNNTIWYIGKPIMIIQNNKTLGLYNGNIGITNISKQGILQVSFLKENNQIDNIPANILRNYETAWAMTVHKAQGSEFFDTSLILPNFYSQLLNKDILYTGITRSQKKLSIFANKKIFIDTILKKYT